MDTRHPTEPIADRPQWGDDRLNMWTEAHLSAQAIERLAIVNQAELARYSGRLQECLHR
jgi:hypothetical protein